MFDANNLITKDATVKEFQWTNPHSWLQVMMLDDNGVAEEWSSSVRCERDFSN
jgi:phage-related protein